MSRADLKLQTFLNSVLQLSKVTYGRRRAPQAVSTDDDAHLEIGISHLSSCSGSSERALLPKRRKSKRLRDGKKGDVYGVLHRSSIPSRTAAHSCFSILIMPGSSIDRAHPPAE